MRFDYMSPGGAEALKGRAIHIEPRHVLHYSISLRLILQLLRAQKNMRACFSFVAHYCSMSAEFRKIPTEGFQRDLAMS